MRDIPTDRMLQAVKDSDRLIIIPHNDPDPDAIASSLALQTILSRTLNLNCEVAYRGIIGRAENRSLVNYLGNPIRLLKDEDITGKNAIALIDTQPGAGNNPVPVHIPVSIVIDHHPPRKESGEARYVDLPQHYGACSSILTEYLQAFGIEPEQKLATALFYGIKTDTRGLSRDTSQTDIDAYIYLQPLIDHEALVNIEYAQVPDSYFETIVYTLHNVQIYDKVVVAYTGMSDYPDMAAEMADFLLRINNSEWVLCTNTYEDDLFISLRTRIEHGGAVNLMKSIVGIKGTAGGHGMMAGGQIPLEDNSPEEITNELRKKTLKYLGVPEGLIGKPLIKDEI